MMTAMIRTLGLALGTAVAIAAAPAPAQMATDPAPPATTDQLNAASSAYVDSRADAQAAAESAEHRADRDAYIAALVAHDRAVDRTNERYARQQMAYADAMAAWRAQVAACKRGHNRACEAPAPRVEDFY